MKKMKEDRTQSTTCSSYRRDGTCDCTMCILNDNNPLMNSVLGSGQDIIKAFDLFGKKTWRRISVFWFENRAAWSDKRKTVRGRNGVLYM